MPSRSRALGFVSQILVLEQETAADVGEQTELAVKEDYRDTDFGHTETVELLDTFDEALDNPEFKEELLKRITG